MKTRCSLYTIPQWCMTHIGSASIKTATSETEWQQRVLNDLEKARRQRRLSEEQLSRYTELEKSVRCLQEQVPHDAQAGYSQLWFWHLPWHL